MIFKSVFKAGWRFMLRKKKVLCSTHVEEVTEVCHWQRVNFGLCPQCDLTTTAAKPCGPADLGARFICISSVKQWNDRLCSWMILPSKWKIQLSLEVNRGSFSCSRFIMIIGDCILVANKKPESMVLLIISRKMLCPNQTQLWSLLQWILIYCQNSKCRFSGG